MKFFNPILCLWAVAALFSSCSSSPEEYSSMPREMVEARFTLPMDAVSRTALAEDGATTEWVVGDKVAIWAFDANGACALDNALFQLQYFSTAIDKAYFTAHIPQMADGYYDYTLCYPQPKVVSGTEATFSLPENQSGEYDSNYDVMISSPYTAGSITSEAEATFDVALHHRMHAIKITIPEGRNLYGKPFTRMELTFPTPVVGDVTFDIQNPDADPIYTNLSNRVVIERASGIDAGDDIWIFVLPGTLDGEVQCQVFTDPQFSLVNSYPVSRTMLQGHVTPINLTTPEMHKYTAFHFSVGANNIGEDFTSFSICDAAGNVIKSFEPNAENHYVIDFEGDMDASRYNNATFKAVFDTPHAIAECSFNMGEVIPYCEYTYAPFVIPYLFEQDFSQVGSFDDGHDNPGTGLASDTYNSSVMLDSYSSLLAGWSASRVGVLEGQSMRICCRFEGGLWSAAYYKGRVDTAPISRLKDNVSAKVTVTFDYGASRTAMDSITGDATMTFGTTTSTGAISPSSNISNVLINATTISDLTATYNKLPSSQSITFDGCTNQTRLSWLVSTTQGKIFAGNGNFHLYLDNIKVQIAQ